MKKGPLAVNKENPATKQVQVTIAKMKMIYLINLRYLILAYEHVLILFTR